MGFLSFVALLAIAYLVWRVADMLPDLIYRISEMQRDIGEIRRSLRAGDRPGDLSDDPPTATDAGANDNEPSNH